MLGCMVDITCLLPSTFNLRCCRLIVHCLRGRDPWRFEINRKWFYCIVPLLQLLSFYQAASYCLLKRRDPRGLIYWKWFYCIVPLLYLSDCQQVARVSLLKRLCCIVPFFSRQSINTSVYFP